MVRQSISMLQRYPDPGGSNMTWPDSVLLRWSPTLLGVILVTGPVIAVPGSGLAAQAIATRQSYTIPEALKILDEAAAQVAPPGLSPAELERYVAQTDWIRSLRKRLAGIGERAGSAAPRDAGTTTGRTREQVEPATTQKELAALRDDAEREARMLTTPSNVMKKRHDTAKNAINNVR